MFQKINLALFFGVILILIGCKNDNEQSSISQSGKTNPDQEEWLSLFNGKNLDDWIIKFSGEDLGVNYKNIVQVEDNTLKIVYKEGDSFKNKFGHIYYKEPFSYYKVRFKYRFLGNQALGAAAWANKNSGIMLHCQDPETQDINQFFPVSLEFQLLGGTNSGDRPTGNLCTPGTYIEMNGEPNFQHCINSQAKTYEGEEWISVEAVVLGGDEIFHIVENDTVLSFKNPKIGGGLINQNTPEEWAAMGFESKEYWLQRDGEVLDKGYLALQAESHPIEFKEIELLNLCGCMDIKAKNYKSYYLKADNSKCIYD